MANSCNNSISYNLLQFPVLLSNSRERKDLEDNVNVDEDDRDNLLVVDLFLVFHVSCLLVLLSQLVRLSAVADAPTIRLIGSPEIDLEEDKDALVLRCVADANPPASIVWRRAGRSEIASLQVSSSSIRLSHAASSGLDCHPQLQLQLQLWLQSGPKLPRRSAYLS